MRVDAIGDFILFLDTLKEYRRLYAEEHWEITLLGNSLWAELAKDLPYFDHSRFIDRSSFLANPFYRLRFLRKIRGCGFDAVVQPTFSREYLFGDALVRASRALERVGSSGDLTNMIPWHKKRSDGWYTRLVPASKEPMSELERNAEFLRGFGLKEFRASPPVYPVEVLPRLRQGGPLDIPSPYFVIAPGAGSAGRRWGARGFADIAKRLYKETGWRPVVCAGPGEERLAKEVVSGSPKLPWVDLSGKTTLAGLVRLLAGAEVLAGNETSIVHFASAAGCPVVCIMGGGHFGRFFPYGNLEKNRIVYKYMDCFGCSWWCKYRDVRCIKEITVEDVWQEIEALLKTMPAHGKN